MQRQRGIDTVLNIFYFQTGCESGHRKATPEHQLQTFLWMGTEMLEHRQGCCPVLVMKEAHPQQLALSGSDTHSSSPDSVQEVALCSGGGYPLAKR